jgi:hypothetical protein
MWYGKLLSFTSDRYIKEFVHGDFGRTVPNMCSLLDVECDILTLDVEVRFLDLVQCCHHLQLSSKNVLLLNFLYFNHSQKPIVQMKLLTVI